MRKLVRLIYQKMINSSIFDDQIQANNKEYRVTDYDYLKNQDEYVSQFLTIRTPPQEQFFINQPKLDLLAENSIQKSQQQIKTKSIPKKHKKCSQKRSLFHNFQKHLVITFRWAFDERKMDKASQTVSCERKLWRTFMDSPKINKTLIIFTFGEMTSFEDQTQNFKDYGFQELLQEFSLQEIKAAQLRLRNEIFRQFQSLDFETLLERRRMKYKDEFIVYLKAFLKQLVKGDLERRMIKCNKLLKPKKNERKKN